MDAACLAFCSKFSPQILLGIHCGSQYPPVCVCVCVCFRLLLCYKTCAHTHKYREVHAHPPIHTRVYIYFNLMPWAIYYCADIIQTQWQWRGASSSSLPASLSPSMPNVEEKMENGECRFMCVFMAPVFRGRPQSQIVNAALGWRWLSTSSSDKCVGRRVELGHSRTGILFRTRDSRQGGSWDWVNFCLPSTGIRQNDYKCFFNYSYGQSVCSK